MHVCLHCMSVYTAGFVYMSSTFPTAPPGSLGLVGSRAVLPEPRDPLWPWPGSCSPDVPTAQSSSRQAGASGLGLPELRGRDLWLWLSPPAPPRPPVMGDYKRPLHALPPELCAQPTLLSAHHAEKRIQAQALTAPRAPPTAPLAPPFVSPAPGPPLLPTVVLPQGLSLCLEGPSRPF